MRLFFVIVLALVIGLAAVWYLPLLQGYVLIRTGGIALEMNLLVLIAAVLGLVLVIHGLIWLWNWPGNVVRGFLERRAEAQLELGMLALSEGDWSRAEKALRLSARNAADPAARYLAAARAASKSAEDNEDRVEAYLAKANESARAQHPIAVTRAQLLLAAGEPARALEILKTVRKPREDRPKVLELLARCHERLEQWDALADLVPALVRHQIIDEAHGQRIETLALSRRMGAASDIGALQQLWNGLARGTRQRAEVLAAYTENAAKLGHGDDVEKVLRQGINRAWSDRLVSLYGQVAVKDAAARLKHAEQWLKLHPDNAVLHLALARLCVRCQLWGKARDHFETAISLQPLPEAYQELGDLHARDGKTEEALACYRRALERQRQADGKALSAD